VRKRLDALETAARETGARETRAGEAVTALEAKVRNLASAVEALKGAGVTAVPQSALSDLGARIDGVSKRLGALEAKPTVDLSGLEGGIADLKSGLAALGGRVDALPTAERVAGLEATLGTLAARVDKTAALGPAVAAGALAAALDSGRPFTAELVALRGLGLDEAAISGLAPHAESGLPTLAALRSDFEAAAADIDLRAPIPEGAGTVERLLQSARGLVEVRPAHPTEGAAPGAVVARMRAALAEGNLTRALAEWEALPADGKAKTADWEKAAEARLAADELVQRLQSDALSRLGSEG
jgi:hypothetical protein